MNETLDQVFLPGTNDLAVDFAVVLLRPKVLRTGRMTAGLQRDQMVLFITLRIVRAKNTSLRLVGNSIAVLLHRVEFQFACVAAGRPDLARRPLPVANVLSDIGLRDLWIHLPRRKLSESRRKARQALQRQKTRGTVGAVATGCDICANPLQRRHGHYPSALTKNDRFVLTKSAPHREHDLASETVTVFLEKKSGVVATNAAELSRF